MGFKIEPLSSSHHKEDFDCGKDLLNGYMHRQARQDVKRRLAACFVLCDEDKLVKGYYTLSSTSIPQALIPAEYAKKYPSSYQDLPATLMGRLAIDKSAIGQGYGEILLMDALKKSFVISETAIGSIAVVVVPIDAEAESFYAKYGFIKLPDSGKMFLPMDTIKALFSS